MSKVNWPLRISLYTLWLGAAVAGLAVLARYQAASGSVGVTHSQWPAHAAVAPDTNHDTLVMFVHPQCPCTRASLDELNRIAARCQGNFSGQIWFFHPAEFSEDWVHAGLWQSARGIPGVIPFEDPEGAQARVFGAETSGFVLLYDPRGKLLFKGGITAGRGHDGDNDGEDAIIALLSGKSAAVHETPVYGCSLLDGCTAPTTNSLP
jgi:hypothetical protein